MLDMSVTVTGGQGETQFPVAFHARLTLLCVEVPSGTNPTYGFNISDPQGNVLYGQNPITGNVSITEDVRIVSNTYSPTLNVVSATSDGVYLFRFYQHGDV